MISCTSPPEQKFPSAPVNTRVLIASTRGNSLNRSRNSAYDSKVRGFFFSGRFRVMTPTRPSWRHRKCCGLNSIMFADVLLQIAHQVRELVLLFDAHAFEQADDPLLMLGRHAPELLLAVRGELDAKHAPIRRSDLPDHQAFLLQPVRDTCDFAAGDHHPLRQLAHLQSLRRTFQLRHEVEAGQSGIEARLQLLADHIFDPVRATQHSQPQPHGQVMVVVDAGFRIHVRLDQFERALFFWHFPPPQVTSPPASTRLWPVTLEEPGRHSHITVSATSRGSMSLRCGLFATRAASASASLRPVLLTMLATALLTISVSSYPGHTAFTVMLRVAYSNASARVSPMTACLELT